MKILAINCSQEALSLAICQDDQLVYEVLSQHAYTHGERLMPHIAQAFEDCGFEVQDLDRVVVAQGPGSYTAIRIAVTTAKTLAWTLGIDLVGVSSLAVLAAKAKGFQGQLLPLMDARRGNIYTGRYGYEEEDLVCLSPDRQVQAQEWAEDLAGKLSPTTPLCLIGKHLEAFKPVFEKLLVQPLTWLQAYEALPSAYDLAMLGRHRPAVEELHTFQPAYLKLTEAEENWLKDQASQGHGHV